MPSPPFSPQVSGLTGATIAYREVRVPMKRWVLLLVVSLSLAFASHVSAQIPTPTPQTTTGFGLSKTCPGTAPPGSQITCTFSVSNGDPSNFIDGLSVNNIVPCPNPPTCAGSPAPVPAVCTQGGLPVTTLGPAGSATDTCIGSLTELAPACGATDQGFQDELVAQGTNRSTQLTVTGTTTNSVQILACTPTPTNTPVNTVTNTRTPTNTPTQTPTNTPTTTSTPTNTPTSTPTRTPTVTSTPVQQVAAIVPTLSFPMLGLLAAALIGAALWLLMRR